MRQLGKRDTVPELRLRRRLHAMGLRYRVDHPLEVNRRRRGDIVFTRQRLVVFVDGCYWHGCPEHFRPPRANAQWWSDKIARNIARDRDTDQLLVDHGWRVVRLWEHQPLDQMVDEVEAGLARPNS